MHGHETTLPPGIMIEYNSLSPSCEDKREEGAWGRGKEEAGYASVHNFKSQAICVTQQQGVSIHYIIYGVGH